ncbi:MAG: phosphonate metabolism protein/1,5-bisphosphokinase (PRPP-forming) PhnN [Rhodobacteraceae bacterium]|nr:phosphonate metabolism protein/1,5-bisphosphokinase (PRPP-forming) PhnN [Paracoccaceae bacterium]
MSAAGRLVAVVGPSGAGKDTLLAAVARACPQLVVARRVITRPATPGGAEAHEPLDRDAFLQARDEGRFAVWWEAHGLLYGIPATIEEALAAGRVVLFNGSRAVIAAARARFPGLEVIAVTAPREVLAARLAARGREGASEVAARLDRAALAPPEGARVVDNGGDLASGVAGFLAALNLSAETG